MIQNTQETLARSPTSCVSRGTGHHDWASAFVLGRFWGRPRPAWGFALFAQRRWGPAGEDYGAQDLAQAAEAGSWQASWTAELSGWPGFPCKPAVVHQAQGWYEVPQPAACAACCLVLSAPPVASWGSCLKPAVNQSLRSFPLPFPLPILLLPGTNIYLPSSPSPSLLLHPQPVVPSPAPSLPTSPRGLPFSV